ncbi:Protein of unknown function [Cotesia congregata]|uniref:Uncharacterized protein n=1 Tax=Cotesia congregata TaxID=51543 RepID=A0A8J2H8B9_COTCN|nr:Protein of unknown function [Cotesia congregata]
MYFNEIPYFFLLLPIILYIFSIDFTEIIFKKYCYNKMIKIKLFMDCGLETLVLRYPILANLFIYLFQISGSGHSSFETTSKHCVNWVNTSTTDTLKRACSLLFMNSFKKGSTRLTFGQSKNTIDEVILLFFNYAERTGFESRLVFNLFIFLSRNYFPVSPLHNERLEPGWVLRNCAFVRWNVLDVVGVEPFHPEVEVHVLGRLAPSVLLVLLEGVLHVHCEDGGQLTDVQLLRELIEHRTVAVLVFLYHRDNQRDQLVPEVQGVQDRAVVIRIPLSFVRVHLELPVVQLVAVLEQELVRRPQASFHAVFHHCASSWWTRQLLDLHSEEGYARQQVHRALQVLQLLWSGCWEVVSEHRQINTQRVVQLVQKFHEFFFLSLKFIWLMNFWKIYLKKILEEILNSKLRTNFLKQTILKSLNVYHFQTNSPILLNFEFNATL